MAGFDEIAGKLPFHYSPRLRRAVNAKEIENTIVKLRPK
jgi:hypothetical protein